MNFIYKNCLKKIGMIAILSVITVSCSNSLMDLNSSGEMNLTLDPDQIRSVISDLDTVPVSYSIEGSNDTGSVFDVLTPDTNIQIPDLSPGTWQIRVCAFNEQGQMIAEGSGTLEVQPGGYTSMTIVLRDATGTGSLDFSLIWNADLVWNESLEICLKTFNGDLIPLIYSQNPGTAAGLTENLSAGFYTLEVQLFDDLVLVMGAMEIVQIRESGVTDIDLDFSQINKPGQRIPINEESFTLEWDVSDTEADEYKIYYREHGSYTWSYLGSTPSGLIPEYTVDQSSLPYGVYDFAVSSVAGSEESELHSSMDDTAAPATGWYIDWQGSGNE